MELYRKYLKEREDVDLIYYEWGFATYNFGEDFVYLQDIYIVPEKRSKGLGVRLMNEVSNIAKEKNIRLMLGSVDDKANGSDSMHKVMKHLDFKKFRKDGTIMYYVKEI